MDRTDIIEEQLVAVGSWHSLLFRNVCISGMHHWLRSHYTTYICVYLSPPPPHPPPTTAVSFRLKMETIGQAWSAKLGIYPCKACLLVTDFSSRFAHLCNLSFTFSIDLWVERVQCWLNLQSK